MGSCLATNDNFSSFLKGNVKKRALHLCECVLLGFSVIYFLHRYLEMYLGNVLQM